MQKLDRIGDTQVIQAPQARPIDADFASNDATSLHMLGQHAVGCNPLWDCTLLSFEVGAGPSNRNVHRSFVATLRDFPVHRGGAMLKRIARLCYHTAPLRVRVRFGIPILVRQPPLRIGRQISLKF